MVRPVDDQSEDGMRTVGAYEAKTHLSDLLDAVSEGEEVVILRHGHPVAVLKPWSGPSDRDVGAAIDALRSFRRGRRLGGKVRDLIEEGRR